MQNGDFLSDDDDDNDIGKENHMKDIMTKTATRKTRLKKYICIYIFLVLVLFDLI